MTDTSERLTLYVHTIVAEAAEILSFTLQRPDGGPLPPATPGSHIDVYLANGLVRQYSLCNGPEDTNAYVIAVKREPASRGGSRFLHDEVKVGDRLVVGLPRNAFPLATNGASHLLVAGGIGITPLLAMARHLAATASPFTLHYFARTNAHLAFRPLLTQPPLGPATHFHLGLDAEQTAARLTTLLHTHAAGAHVYTCGPGPLIAAVRETATAHGWPAAAIHDEYFGAPPAKNDGRDHGFTVHLERQGATIRVESGESIVTALARQGVTINVSCEQGICGTCLTPVLGGVADHRDSYLTEAEKQAGRLICPCVSRAAGDRLVLDL